MLGFGDNAGADAANAFAFRHRARILQGDARERKFREAFAMSIYKPAIEAVEAAGV